MEYNEFIRKKEHTSLDHGFDPLWIPDKLFDFQKSLTTWAIKKGRCAIFSDCGTGKSFMQLVWAENVVRKTNGRVLVLTPLAVAKQTKSEGEKIGVEVANSREGLRKSDKILGGMMESRSLVTHGSITSETIGQLRMIWAAALESAWRDIWGGDEMARLEARRRVKMMDDDFSGFAWCCEMFHLHPGQVARKLLSGPPEKKYAPVHGKYRGDNEKHRKNIGVLK